MKRDRLQYDKQLGLIVIATFGVVVIIEITLLFFSIWAGV